MQIISETKLQEKVVNLQNAFRKFSNDKCLENAQALANAKWELCAYVIGSVK